MSGWRDWLYPFPDDNFDSLWRVMDMLPSAHRAALDWEAANAFVISIADPLAAVYLRMAFDTDRITALDGETLLDPDEVLIRLHERAECEKLLIENCPSANQWQALVRISVLTDKAQAFGAAYTAITGLPNAALKRSGKRLNGRPRTVDHGESEPPEPPKQWDPP